jgi:hypothetical protein
MGTGAKFVILLFSLAIVVIGLQPFRHLYHPMIDYAQGWYNEIVGSFAAAPKRTASRDGSESSSLAPAVHRVSPDKNESSKAQTIKVKKGPVLDSHTERDRRELQSLIDKLP